MGNSAHDCRLGMILRRCRRQLAQQVRPVIQAVWPAMFRFPENGRQNEFQV